MYFNYQKGKVYQRNINISLLIQSTIWQAQIRSNLQRHTVPSWKMQYQYPSVQWHDKSTTLSSCMVHCSTVNACATVVLYRDGIPAGWLPPPPPPNPGTLHGVSRVLAALCRDSWVACTTHENQTHNTWKSDAQQIQCISTCTRAYKCTCAYVMV